MVLAGRYEVGELLGRGGMAVVHSGRDLRLGRRVAIKMLRTDLARDPSFQARFRREAQSAAGLNHPSIVAVYDTGEDLLPSLGGSTERVPFIVMEYVPGRTLREQLHADDRTPPQGVGVTADPGATVALGAAGRGAARPGLDTPATPAPLGVEQAVRITTGVLSALAYSHRAGIVHRDIKPANVMITAAGAIKVMDFGIARAMADASATMTQTQAVIGTAQYLSPEQAEGKPVDARSDLYSCGCLLFELLTGRPPFVGDSPVSVAYQHVREEPLPPSTFNRRVTPELDQVVLHALAKDREHRYPDADAFRADLQAAARGLPVAPLPVAAATTTALPRSPEPFAPVRDVTPLAVLPVPPDDEEEPTRGRAAGYVALALAVLAVFALAAFLVTQVLGEDAEPAPEAAVPSVVEMTRVQAKQLVEDAGLVYVEGEPQNDDAVPAEAVISQDPAAGALVAPGTEVSVVVSLGVGEVLVPDLANRTQQEARAALNDLGLTLGNVTTEDHPSVPAESVIRTVPAADANVPEGSEVSLVVSSGEVTVPNLADLDYLAARSQLAELGLVSAVTFEETTEVEPDRVIRQDPAPGSVPQGGTVTLVVASAPAPTATEEPVQPTEPTTSPTTGPTSPTTEPPPDEEPPPP